MKTLRFQSAVRPGRVGLRFAILAWIFLAEPLALPAQLLSNLQAFPDRISVGDPQVTADENREGPKGIASADFNGDGLPDLAVGNLDGTITVLIGSGNGRFAAPQHLRTGAEELRGVLAADLNGDGQPDLAAASPLDGQLLVYLNSGGGTFGAARPLEGWLGVRTLASGDFNGDGVTDLAAAGPGRGVRHFRGAGDGAFEIMGDLPRLSPLYPELPRPVYSLRTIRSVDGLRDDLLVTHAESPALWILSTVPADRASEPPMDLTRLPSWGALPSPVLISEVQVHNAETLLDADGTAQPWVELMNKSTAPVNLSGWKLKSQSQSWTFPSVTVDPGRMRVVFLSAKNRLSGAEVHASFVLKQNSTDITLVRADGTVAHQLMLKEHSATGTSFGLAPDLNANRYFDIPSPGAENNAGFADLDGIPSDSGFSTTLTITPRNPLPGESVTVRVTMPEQPTGTSAVRHVWFSATPGLTEEHHLLHRISTGVYEEVLPPGAFTGATPHRVLARLRDGTSNDFTKEVHRGLDEPQSAGPVLPKPGRLLPVASVPSPKAKAFEVGPVFTPATGAGAPIDLVFADETCGMLRMHRAGPGARRFDPMAIRNLAVAGVPRDVKLADTDGDGWLDATVVLREMDLALTVRNTRGTLKATGELPTGRSPREVVMADFNGDGKPDAAVINRYSADVSILPSSSSHPGLVSLDQIYPVHGQIAGLVVRDFNGDGRDDVMQLSSASGEVSLRHSGPDGTLGPAEFIGVGGQSPSGAATADLNNDGRPDIITANLGRYGVGSISVLLADPGGGYATPREIGGVGSMFAIAAADFDNDGNTDIVAGLFDCRVAFFRGDGTGNFTSQGTTFFVYESRVMVTGDFDQDGDTDIAGAGYAGDVVTLENKGAFTWNKVMYSAPDGTKYGTERIGITDANGDSDPDLVIGSGHGVMLYTGRAGITFALAPESSANVSFSVSDVFTRDLDGDGRLEMVVACRNASCINILTQNAAGQFTLVTQADVPSGRYLATGDLDGDGKPDIVGTGDALWTVLSSRPPQPAAPEENETSRVQSGGMVINEVLSQNTGLPIAADNGRNSDFVEIFNGATAEVDLAGWMVRLKGAQDGSPVNATWTFPASRASGKGRTLLLFSSGSGALHTGFTLPAEGGTLTLMRPDGSEADTVVYPRSSENVSWSRYLDGHPTFHAEPVPSPGMPNLDNGSVPPEVRLTLPSPSTLVSGQPLKFTAQGRDDSGILSMSLLWNRIDAPFAETQRLILYDDGMHDDGNGVDGLFAGLLAPGLPAGAEVQFYLEAVGLSGEVLLLPEVAELVGPGETPVAWSFSLSPPPTLEIVEASALTRAYLSDESGEFPDFVVVGNTGEAPVALDGILLAKSPLSKTGAVFAFPSGIVLQPGARVTVFADNKPATGPLHAPFTLDAGGDDISLLATTPSGARQWIHSLTLPPSPPLGLSDKGTSYRQLPGTDLRAILPLGVTIGNWSGIAFDANGQAFATARFESAPGFTYTLEGETQGMPGAWSPLGNFPGDGTVRTVTRPQGQFAALRVTPVASGPLFVQVDGVFPGSSHASVYGEAASSATVVTVYYGLTDGGTDSGAWSGSLRSSSPTFGFNLPTLASDARYYFNVRATRQDAGGNPQYVWAYSGGRPFTTLAAGMPVPEALVLTRLNPTVFTAEVTVTPPPPPGAMVALLAGRSDAYGTVNGWERAVRAHPSSTTGNWSASFVGLDRDTRYFVRAVVTSPAGSTVSPSRLEVRTPDARSNLAWNLRISEIMYHPSPPDAAETAAGFEEDDFEFVELHNDSDEHMDLSGLWFGSGLAFTFPPSGAPLVPPGGYVVIAANPHAFAVRYGADIPLAGWTLHPFRNARLSNGGEHISLSAAGGTDLVTVIYNDSQSETDGGGDSLEFVPPTDRYRPETGGDYLGGLLSGGTPGSAPLPRPDLDSARWQTLHFSPVQMEDPGVSGMRADPDRDSIENLVEFACGTDPLRPDAPSLLRIDAETIPNAPSVVTLSYPVNPRAKGVSFRIASSQNLGAFSTSAFETHGLLTPEARNFEWWLAPVSNGYGIVGPYSTSRTLSQNGTQVIVTLRGVVGGSPLSGNFYRLSVTTLP